MKSIWPILPISLIIGAVFSADLSISEAEPKPNAIPPVDLIYPVLEKQVFSHHDLPGSEMTDRGRNVRGIYIPVWMMTNKPVDKFVQWVVKRVGATAVMLDIKDDMGRVTFTDQVPGATNPAHGPVKNMRELVHKLKENGVYTIGRMVCFKDNKFSRAHPKEAIRNRLTKKRWKTSQG
jgi:hypothetical protein